MRIRMKIGWLLVMLTAAAARENKMMQSPAGHTRNPKLFWVSSSTATSTSTLSTTTLCWSQKGTAKACGASGRKKRAIVTDPVTGVTIDLEDYVAHSPQPTKVQSDSAETEIESGQEKEEGSDREGKFLLYWMTTTSTSVTTTTSFTATTKFIVSCTPSSFTMSTCG